MPEMCPTTSVSVSRLAAAPASQPGAFLLQHLVAGQVGACHAALNHDKLHVGKFRRNDLRRLAVLAAMGDDEVGLVLGQLAQGCRQQVAFGLARPLDLAPGTLDAERRVLADHGNISAPTVLFVLAEVLRNDPPSKLMAMALGPGFTLSILPITVA